jgi:hypothetical protein
MVIPIVNFTDTVEDEEVQRVIRAINRQIEQDYQPYWSMGATLRLEGHEDTEDRQAPQELRGDAIIYLWDKKADVEDAIGYHDRNNKGLPYGFGGYVGFFNPATGDNEIFTADALAEKRRKIKAGLKETRVRRASRHRDLNKAAVRRAAA